MKRFLSVLFVLMLVFTGASASKMLKTFDVPADYYGFKMYVPGDWTIVPEQVDNYGQIDLGYMYSGDKSELIVSKLNFYSEWAQVSLWQGNPDYWQAYKNFVTRDLAGENAEIVREFKAEKHPGVILKGTNASGDYLYGEIMVNAYAYGFYYYHLDEQDCVVNDLTEEDIDFLQGVMETFRRNDD